MNYLYDVATGRLVSVTSLPIETVPEGMAVTFSEVNGAWNPETRAVEPVESVDWGNRYEVIDFLRLFTTPERVGIRVAAKTDPVIEDFMAMLDAAEGVWTQHPDTIAGIGYLQQQGLLTAERAAEVLNG